MIKDHNLQAYKPNTTDTGHLRGQGHLLFSYIPVQFQSTRNELTLKTGKVMNVYCSLKNCKVLQERKLLDFKNQTMNSEHGNKD